MNARLRIFFVLVTLFAYAGCGSPRLDSVDPKERVEALNELTDQSQLFRIWKEDRDETVRRAALSRITDEEFLLQIVLGGSPRLDSDGRQDSRLEALDKINDERRLTQVALRALPQQIREIAANRVSNHTFLFEIALRGYGEPARIALNRIDDPQQISKIAISGSDPFQRRSAIYKLNDNGTSHYFPEIVSKIEDPEIAWLAMSYIRDDSTLAKLEQQTRVPPIRAAARLRQASLAAGRGLSKEAIQDLTVARLHDVSDAPALARIALTHKQEDVQKAAVDLLKDEVLLVWLATNAQASPFVRSRCAARIESREWLELLAGNSWSDIFGNDHFVKAIAFTKLSLQSPSISARYPRVELAVTRTRLAAPYRVFTYGPRDVRLPTAPSLPAIPENAVRKPIEVYGEEATITIRTPSKRTLASRTWQTDFPERIENSSTTFVPAKINLVELFETFFRRSAYSSNELASIAIQDQLFPVRAGATMAVPVSERSVLQRIATESDDSAMRSLANKRLSGVE